MPTLVSTMVQVHPCRRHPESPFLLLRRADTEPVYPGLWQVVTGTIEPGEHAGDTALRELREETGIVATGLDVLPMTGSFYLPRTDEIHLVPAFACLVSEETLVRLSDEHQEFRWCSYEEARHLLVFPSHQQGLDLTRHWVLSPGPRSILQTYSPLS